MRLTRMLVPTLKELPGDAVVASHILMLRAGMIRKVAAGVYNFLPLGVRVLQKVETIIREEMNRAGAFEVIMPSAIPAELWEESGRWEKFGPELLRFKDRKGANFCYGPTHEEVITDLVRHEVRSYRDLPLNLYQIQTKFRDEIRPRFGVMRVREFKMKDAYSFDVSAEAAKQSYELMYEAYNRIFKRCGLDFRAVLADTGAIGGDLSHEFQVLAESGEDVILASDTSDFAANVELCGVGGVSETPAAEIPSDAEAATLVDTPEQKSIEEVSAFLKLDAAQMIKSLVYAVDEEPVMVLVRGDHELAEPKLRKALGASHVELADEATIAEVTGAPRGFAGPVALPKPVKIVADFAVRAMSDAATGGNVADQHYLHVYPGRDFEPASYHDLRQAQPGDASPDGEGSLREFRGIEVGHVFYLGTKYSEAMRCEFLDDNGRRQPAVMGCYGIGVARTAAAAIEQNHDDGGIIWPAPIAPYHCVVMWLQPKDEVKEAAEKIYEALVEAGVEVVFDDRKERAGVKFKDADLIGYPVRVAIGGRGLEEGVAEVKLRRDEDVQKVPLGEVAGRVQQLIAEELARAAV